MAFPDANAHSANSSMLTDWRLKELERRIGRIEAFILGGLATVAVSVLGGVLALLNLPT